MKQRQAQLISIFKQYPVVLAYQHGSSVSGKKGPLSDLDFAVLFKDFIKKDRYLNLRLEIMDRLGRIFSKEKIDLVVLNEASPLLKSLVVNKGKLLYCQNEDRKIEFMATTVQEYDDFDYLRQTFYYFLEKRTKNNHLGRRLYDQR